MLVFRRLVLLVGLVAWVLSTSAASVHEVVVRHAECHEHGETLDVAPSVSERDPTAQITANGATGHGHACAFEGLVLAGVVLHLPVTRATFEVEARGPPARACAANLASRPLAYAPKTSPPVPGSSSA